MQKLQAVPIHLVSNSIFIPHDLRSCSHIFLCHDAVRKPLHPIYGVPFPVIKRGEIMAKNLLSLSIAQNPHILASLCLKNATSVFSSDPPVKQKEKSIQ